MSDPTIHATLELECRDRCRLHVPLMSLRLVDLGAWYLTWDCPVCDAPTLTRACLTLRSIIAEANPVWSHELRQTHLPEWRRNPDRDEVAQPTTGDDTFADDDGPLPDDAPAEARELAAAIEHTANLYDLAETARRSRRSCLETPR